MNARGIDQIGMHVLEAEVKFEYEIKEINTTQSGKALIIPSKSLKFRENYLKTLSDFY